MGQTAVEQFKNGTDLDVEMFAFLSWLDFNRDVETIDGLLRKDGYEWYNSQWKSWLHNSDAGQRVLNYSGTVSWWGGNPDMNDGMEMTADEKTTTVNKPEQHNPNKASLETMEFRFTQEANCVDGTSDDIEELIVEVKSSIGIDRDGGAFYVLKTKQFAINDANEMNEILKRVEAALAATNPTSVHTK